jgi:hypothetical protein
MNQLNRNICFINNLVIKNETEESLLFLQFDENKKPIENEISMKPGDLISVERNWFVQFSFLKSSSHSKTTNRASTPLTNVSNLFNEQILLEENKKFQLTVSKKHEIIGHSMIIIRAPIIIHNCLPKDI